MSNGGWVGVFALAGGAAGWLACFVAGWLLRRRGRGGAFDHRLQLAVSGLLALLYVAAYLALGWEPRLLYLLLMTMLAAMLSITDLKARLIPNCLVLAVFVVAGSFAAAGLISFDWRSSLVGMLLCLILFLLPSLWGKHIGMGDVKLAAAIGFAAGLMDSLYTIVVMGGLLLAMSVFQSNLPLADAFKKMIPMGPFLAIAFLMVQVVLW